MKSLVCAVAVGAASLFACSGAVAGQAGMVDVFYKGTIDFSIAPDLPVGAVFEAEMMVDLLLPDLNPDPGLGHYGDPWQWHFGNPPLLWINEFTVTVDPVARLVQLEAELGPGDDNMSQFDLGTRLVSSFRFMDGVLLDDSLTGVRWNSALFDPQAPSTLEVFGADGTLLASGQITFLVPSPSGAAALLLLGGVGAARRRR